MSEVPDNEEAITASRLKAAAVISTTFQEAIGSIAAEQVRLALGAKHEGTRMKAGQKIIEHVVGSPKQTFESTSRSIKIVSHIPMAGFVSTDKTVIEATVIPDLPPPPMQKFLAAVDESPRKSTYQGNIKKDQEVPDPPTGRLIDVPPMREKL